MTNVAKQVIIWVEEKRPFYAFLVQHYISRRNLVFIHFIPHFLSPFHSIYQKLRMEQRNSPQRITHQSEEIIINKVTITSILSVYRKYMFCFVFMLYPALGREGRGNYRNHRYLVLRHSVVDRIIHLLPLEVEPTNRCI